MRKIVVSAFVSLDGVMQAPGGPEEDPIGGFRFGGWVAPFFDETAGATIGELFAKPFDLLLGRKTYDIFAAHWPYAGADDPIGLVLGLIDHLVGVIGGNLQESRGSARCTRALSTASSVMMLCASSPSRLRL